MKVGGYNIMKQPTSQGVVKSRCVLVNVDKILKWRRLWATQVKGEEFMSWRLGGGWWRSRKGIQTFVEMRN
jgi:hypothetical protein